MGRSPFFLSFINLFCPRLKSARQASVGQAAGWHSLFSGHILSAVLDVNCKLLHYFTPANTQE